MEPPMNPAQMRRRKKRSSGVGGGGGGCMTSGSSGSSLTGLRRNNIRVVELVRKTNGYGFTISGQKPCLLRSIIDGSPAALAGLRRGHCLVGVNGKEVTHLAHDEVVGIIGNCTGLLRLHVAESYFSESSDDEAFQARDAQQQRFRYSNHRPRGQSKTSLYPTKRYSQSHSPLTHEARRGGSFLPDPIPHHGSGQSSNSSSWSMYDETGLPLPTPPVPFQNSDRQSRNRPTSSSTQNRPHGHVETVRVFDSLDKLYTLGTSGEERIGITKPKHSSSHWNNHGRYNTNSSSGGSTRGETENPTRKTGHGSGITSEGELENGRRIYQVVVGYVGSMELPEIKQEKRLETLSGCIRIFRKQKKCLKYRSLVLLRIQPTGISVFGSFQNAEKDSPITFYPAKLISFCGAASDDRRFFGLVTFSDPLFPSTSSSCHVFMLEPKLLGHETHAVRAECFGIKCRRLPCQQNGHVLGLQECDEFPGTADLILSSILHLQPASCKQEKELEQKNSTSCTSLLRPLSEASNRHESTTTSSNSDSGIGFRDDSDRLSGKIYDIVDPESVSFEVKRIQHHSPVPKKKLPLPGNRRLGMRRDPSGTYRVPQPALRLSKISPKRGLPVGHSHPPIPGIKKTVSSDVDLPKAPPPIPFYPSEEDFETDPNSMNEILTDDRNFGKQPPPIPAPPTHPGKSSLLNRFSLNAMKHRSRQGRLPPKPPVESSLLASDPEIPRPLEVSVIIVPPTPPKKPTISVPAQNQDKRKSMDFLTPIPFSQRSQQPQSDGSEGHLNSSALYPIHHHRVSCGRYGGVSRSLDNLCSPEVLVEDFLGLGGVTGGKKLEMKGSIGSSTPALNHDALKPIRDEFWEFKVPEAPKPNFEISQAEKWGESIEKLLSDSNGMEVFTEFLEHEFSAENIHFYTECLRFKESFPDLADSQKIAIASLIFQKHLQNGATDPINVDHQARNKVEKALSQPTLEMFDLPLSQVFNLLKFDCYPRFLRSETYRDYVNGSVTGLQSLGDPTDSDADSVKSQSKLHSDTRRRSLLPWNIRSRSKAKNRANNEFGLNSDMSFIQKTALAHGCDETEQDVDLRRQSYKVCRVVLPDKSTTVLPCKPGETLSTVVERLLEKREFTYSAFEVICVSNGKPIDLNMQVSNITAREIRVEPRAFVEIELPLGWKVGIRANIKRQMAEVLKPILAQHSLKLDNILMHDMETGEPLELTCPVGKVDGHNISVQIKGDIKLEEFTNHIAEFPSSESHQFFDDDQLSAKTSSSHASSVFKDFLRRSSKKYKRDKPPKTSNVMGFGKKGAPSQQGNMKLKSGDIFQNMESKEHISKCHDGTTAISDAQRLPPPPRPNPGVPKLTTTASTNLCPTSSSPLSLSLVPSELHLVQNSRNRKPIYINQAIDKQKTRNE